jgi:hypothetical protein
MNQEQLVHPTSQYVYKYPSSIRWYYAEFGYCVINRFASTRSTIISPYRCSQSQGFFPNEASLLRLVSAIGMERSKGWLTGERYLYMNLEMKNESEFVNPNDRKIYKKYVA